MKLDYSLFINGEFQDLAERKKQPVVNPATGEILAEVTIADTKDIDLAVSAARIAFDQGPWRNISLSEHKNFLFKISQAILDKAGELAKLEALNTGKPIKETTFMDIPSAAKTFAYFADNLEKYLKEETLKLENAESCLVREPHGVAVLIVPWNYPLLIASWKLAAALAAGNSVVLKPSSLTPLTVLELAKMIKEIGFPKGAVNIIHGPGELLGERLCGHKDVDMISFTGSNKVGKEIMQYAARNVKKTTMELAGKSAGIVLKDAEPELAVNGSLCSIFLNQGQMCTAMSRIFIEESIYDDFVEDFVRKVKKIKLGNSLDYQTQMGPLISEAQRKNVISFVERAKKEGAKLLSGGRIPDNPELKKGFFFEPTVFAEVSRGMNIFQEEVFGPVVCLDKFSALEEAINLANATDFALAASIWTKDTSQAEALGRRINAGIVWINTYGMFYNEVPYGGFKQSGFGKELGREGFLEYTRLKNIFLDRTKDAKPLVNYWYGV